MSTSTKRSELSKPVEQYRFGSFTLDTARGSLSDGDVAVNLRPKSFRVLRYLLNHPGELVSKTQLHDEVWGKTVVTDDAITQCIIDIRRAIGDKTQKMLRTVPRRGYIFELPVSTGAMADSRPVGGADGRTKASQSNKSPLLWVATGLVMICLMAAGFWQLTSTPDLQIGPAGEYSVAVLPFDDMSADGSLGYFADGMSEEILNLLAQSSQLHVVARTSSFSFRGGDADIATIAKKLGVTHVLEGSVRDDDQQIRVTAQLVEAGTGGHLWSETYDRTLDEVFEVQDDISRQVYSRLTDSLALTEPYRRQTDPEAYRLFLHAKYIIDSGRNDLHGETIALLKEVLEIDPDYGPAWREMSRVQARNLGNDETTPAALDELRLSLSRAVAFSPDDPGVLAYLGWHQAENYGDLAAAARIFEQALAIDPDHEDLLRPVILFATVLGDFDQAVRLGEHAMQSNPLCAMCLRNLVSAYLKRGDLDKAELANRKFQVLFQGGNYFLGNILLLAGRPVEAMQSYSKVEIASYRLAGIAMAQHSIGEDEQSEQTLSRYFESLDTSNWHTTTHVLAWTGRIDEAFIALDSMISNYQIRDDGRIIRHNLIQIALELRDPMLMSLRDDPRWLPLLESFGLSEQQLANTQFSVPALN